MVSDREEGSAHCVDSMAAWSVSAVNHAAAERLGRPLIEVSYEKLDQWVNALQPQLQGERFQLIVGVLRGGAPLALMVSHVTGVEPIFLRYERATRTVIWESSLPIPAAGAKILLCEDIAGAGHTLTDCVQFLQSRGLIVRTLTAAFDDLSRLRPHYALDARGYYALFPWERQAFTADYRSQWQEAAAGLRDAVQPDHTFARYGIDLDGVLLPDLPLQLYEQCLESALSARDKLLPFSVLPQIDHPIAVITGRPEMDRQRTQDWLDQHGFSEVKLVMRHPSLYSDSAEDVARFKASQARALGCTHFIESDPVQALYIAKNFPLLHTVWWDAEGSEGHCVSAQPWRGQQGLA